MDEERENTIQEIEPEYLRHRQQAEVKRISMIVLAVIALIVFMIVMINNSRSTDPEERGKDIDLQNTPNFFKEENGPPTPSEQKENLSPLAPEQKDEKEKSSGSVEE